jgi:vacuolar protein sorting-associated protein 35
MASHLWWQSPLTTTTTTATTKEKEEDDDDKIPFRDGKRVLECLQKSLRIATSSIDELTSVQLYCDALDQYLYYFERGVQDVGRRLSLSLSLSCVWVWSSLTLF